MAEPSGEYLVIVRQVEAIISRPTPSPPEVRAYMVARAALAFIQSERGAHAAHEIADRLAAQVTRGEITS
jgi:hypothetical protein